MSQDLKDELRTKASVVLGSRSWDRAVGDPVVESAIVDAEEFFKSLPPDVEKPKIWAGCTAEPERILTMSWLMAGPMGFKSASVSFKGNKKFDVFWDDTNGKHSRFENIGASELAAIDIPAKVARLKEWTLTGAASSRPRRDFGPN